MKIRKKAIKQVIKEKLLEEGGTKDDKTINKSLKAVQSAMNDEDKAALDEKILTYAKSSLKDWKVNPSDSELAQFSLFMQINDGESDLMASWDELQILIPEIRPFTKEKDGQEMSAEERAKEAFDKYQNNNFLDFRQFQDFLEDTGLVKLADQIDQFLYRLYYRRNCCTLLIGRCCASKFRKVRMNQVANRLKKIIEIENQRTPTKPTDFFMLVTSALQVLGGIAQLFDFYSDIAVLWVIYQASIAPENENIQNDYQVALTICFIALVATFMAQQSCIIGMKFAQGDFEPQNFKKSGCFAKILNIFLLTITGILFIIPIEIIDNLTKIFKLPGLLFGGSKGVQKVADFFNYVKHKLTGLNTYQLNCLEQQRKITALLFENLPFTALVFAIKVNLLNCPELSQGKSSTTVNISLFSTLLQVASAVFVTYMESRWLQESTLSYLMTKMTANNNWIPFIHKIAKRDCKININYGDLSIVVPFISHALGHQIVTQYEFSDNTLMYLLNELKLWSSEVRGQKQIQRYRLIFTKDCLNQVSLNTFIHFVENFPQDVFILEIQLNWKDFYNQKEQEGFIQYAFENGQKRTFSPTGVPLLLLCIQNETSNVDWPLKKMLHIILNSRHYALFDTKHGSPLTVALQNNCFESIHVINSGDYDFDYQTQDANGQSFIGDLVQKMLELTNEEGEEFDKLRNFSEPIFNDIQLDMHKEQFANVGTQKKKISAWQLCFKSLRHHRMIKWVTLQILKYGIQRQTDFNLTHTEKQTLFKNSVKLMMSWNKSDKKVKSCWSQMSFMCKKFNIDIFEMRDKRDKTFAYRLVKAWPVQIVGVQALESIFKHLKTKEMEDQNVNLISKVFQQIVSENLVTEVVGKSIYTVKQILQIDSNNTHDIKVLDDTEANKKKIIILLSKALMQNMLCYNQLLPLLRSRLKNFPDLDQQVENHIRQQMKNAVSQAKETEDDKEDIAEFEGSRLTRRMPGNGNHKRKVCDEIQKDVSLNKLSAQQIKNMGIVENSPSVIRKKKLGSGLRSLLETVLEWIAAADLYTDVIVFLQLLNSPHHAWTTMTIFSLLAPFFACQTPFLMFLKEKVYRDKKNRLKLRLTGEIMVSPFMLMYMFTLDVIFVINQAFLLPLIQILRFLTCGLIDLACLNRALEKSYEHLFEMQKLEVAGFRRMRTISQLTFESLIQTVLQIRMLRYFQDKPEEMERYDISTSTIALSILLAFSHAILESIFLYMEAQASKTSFINYCIVCFNGRFGWVPYNDYLLITSQQMLEDAQDKDGKNKRLNQKIELDFQNIQSKVLCFDMQVEFIFSDDTMISLSKTLASFPIQRNEKDMPIIRFGHTANNVSLENLESLLRVCHGKILIDLQGTDLENIYKKSRHVALLENKDINNLSKEDSAYIFDLLKSRLYQLLSFILSYNQENLKATTTEPSSSDERTLALIAYHNRDAVLLDLLLSLDSDVLKAQMREVVERNSLTLRFINTIDFDLWVALASNSAIFNPHQESLIFQAFMDMQTADPALFRRSMKWWHSRFGPGMPQEIINDVMRYSSAHDFMKEYKRMYPEQVYVMSGKHYVTVECRTAFCFASIRKKLCKAWEISIGGPSIDPEESEGTFNRPLDISDLKIPLTDFKLLNMILSDNDHQSIKNLTAEKVYELDKWAVKLKIDLYKWLYIGRTRLGDETGYQIETIFYGRDRRAPNTDKELKYPIEAGFNKTFDIESDDQHSYYDSLVVQLPETMSWITYHKSYHAQPQENTTMSTFIFQKDIVLRGFMFNWEEKRKSVEEGDCVIIAQTDEEGRAEAITTAKPLYQIDSMIPGAKCYYCAQSLFDQHTTLQNFRCTMRIDFPPDVDIEKEQQQLEAQAQLSRKDYENSLKDYKKDNEKYYRNVASDDMGYGSED